MNDALYHLILLIPVILISLALVIMTWRIVVGPDSMDRVLGLDGLIAIVQTALALYMCITLDTTIVNAMVVVALLGFISTISVARFRRKDGIK